jgi:hypothetical protein
MKINGLKFMVSMAALLVAGCAAFYSVTGLATLFAGSYVLALILFTSLEFGKLVITSFLYQWWNKCATWLKTYLVAAVIILMVITSSGIFGFLSSAYQDSALKYEIHTTKIEAIEDRVELVDSEIESVKNRMMSLTDARRSQEDRLDSISEQIGKTLTGTTAQKLQESTQKLIEQSSNDINNSQVKLDELSTKKNGYSEQMLDLKINSEGSREIQNFQFLAETLGVALDTVVMWVIGLIIVVFDPLAVALVLAYNVMLCREEDVKPVKVVEAVKDVVVETSDEDTHTQSELLLEESSSKKKV